jgi:hypothetical protein
MREFSREGHTIQRAEIFPLDSRKRRRETAMRRKTSIASLVALFLLTSLSALAAGSGEKVKNKGVLTNALGTH